MENCNFNLEVITFLLSFESRVEPLKTELKMLNSRRKVYSLHFWRRPTEKYISLFSRDESNFKDNYESKTDIELCWHLRFFCQRFSLGAAEINGVIYAVGGYDGKEYLKYDAIFVCISYVLYLLHRSLVIKLFFSSFVGNLLKSVGHT